MSLTAKDVAEIVRLLEESSFDELELQSGDLKLSLRRGEGGAAPSLPRDRTKSAPAPAKAEAPAEHGPPTKAAAASSDPNAQDVPSPLLGVFYRAPKPGEAAFIEVGSKVTEDTVIGIIEVMKLMNTVRAGARGRIVEILARDGVLVEYGEALMRVDQTG